MSATTTIRSNVPEEVVIGTQTWMKRNYDFGGIPYDNLISNIPIYGKLYTWDEAMLIDYPGWHLPSNTEWTTLIAYLGGSSVAGGHLKEDGTTYWALDNADNSSIFTALPGGYWLPSVFMYKTEEAAFWTSNEYDGTNSYFVMLYDHDTTIDNSTATGKVNKLSIRLIKEVDIFEEVVIGTQTWMKYNYNIGGLAPGNDSNNIKTYGSLYTWAEAVAIGEAVSGWHLPTQTEINTLVTYLGGTDVAGGKLKEVGLTHWSSPNTGADNSSEFRSRGAGTGIADIAYNFKSASRYWSITESSPGWSYCLVLNYNNDDTLVTDVQNDVGNKYSVRLIKD